MNKNKINLRYFLYIFSWELAVINLFPVTNSNANHKNESVKSPF